MSNPPPVTSVSPLDFAFGSLDSASISKLKTADSSINTDNLTSRINTNEVLNLNQSLNLADSQSQQALNYGILLSRNNTISDITEELGSTENQTGRNQRDTYSRQAEINEWSAQNRFDTLFFLQITFLFFSVAVILLFLRHYGILPTVSVSILLGVLLLIVLGIFWNRASYTSVSRDKRYWNRRFIGLDDANLKAKLQCIS